MNFGKFITGSFVAGTARASKAAILGASKNLDVLGLPVGGLKIGPAASETPITASAAELNTLTDSARYQAAGSTLAVTAAMNRKVIKLDTLTGSVVTLPASSGSGNRFHFLVSLLATSNSHIIKVANSTDVMRGIIHCLDSDLATVNMFGFAAGATADTITLDRTNTGSVTLGEWVEVEDYAAGFWAVRGVLSGAAPATPFSATV